MTIKKLIEHLEASLEVFGDLEVKVTNMKNEFDGDMEISSVGPLDCLKTKKEFLSIKTGGQKR